MDCSDSNREELCMTSEEMIDRCHTWTLRCDNSLLNKLKSISENLEQNSEEIKKDCESLSKDVTLLQGKLCNVTNQFLMLSNSQFVENRVEEFEESSTSTNSSLATPDYVEKNKTKAQKETELIAKMTEAIQIGVSANEQNSQLLSDNQDSFSTSSKLSLPHLIGSSKFFSSRYVGLVDDTARYSMTPSTSKVDEPSHENSYSSETEIYNQDQPKPKIIHSHNVLPEIIPNENRTDLSNNYSSIQNTNINKSAHEPSVIERPGVKKRPNSSPPPVSYKDNQFFSVPPPPVQVDVSDDSEDDFKPVASGASGRLFADDDDDLFNDSSLFPPKQNENLFFNNRNVFPNVNNPIIVPPSYNGSNETNNTPTNGKGAVFAGRMPENDMNATNTSFVPTNHNNKPLSGADSQQNFSNPETHSKLKIPAGAVSVFGKLPPTEIPRPKNQQNIQPKTLSSENQGEDLPNNSLRQQTASVSRGGSSIGTNEDHETTSHSSLTSKGMTSSQGSLSETNAGSTRSRENNGLFDDDSDEDLFFSTKKRPDIKVTTGSSNLFNDDSFLRSNLPPPLPKHANLKDSKSANKEKVRRSIFEESDSDDDLFSSASSSSSKTKTTLSKSIFGTNSSSAGVSHESKSTSLFGNDSESVDLFANDIISDSKSKSSKANDRLSKMNENANIIKKSHSETEDDALGSSSEDNIKMSKDKENKTQQHDEQQGSDNVDSSANDAKCDMQTSTSQLSSSSSSKDTEPQSSDTLDSAGVSSEEKNTIKDKKGELKDNQLKKTENNTPQKVKTDIMGKQDSKISKIKEALASSDLKTASNSSKDDPIKNSSKTANTNPKVSVKKLALGLNINPLAMRPGAKLLKSPASSLEKSDSVGSPETEVKSPIIDPEDFLTKKVTSTEIDSTPATPTSPDKLPASKVSEESSPETLVPSTPTSPVKGSTNSGSSSAGMSPNTPDFVPFKTSKPEIQSEEDTIKEGSSQILPSLGKGRVRIQCKRRPPSKQLLKAYQIKVEEERELKVEEDPDKKDTENDQKELSVETTTEDINVDTKEEPEEEEPISEQIPTSSSITNANLSPSTEEEDVFPSTKSQIFESQVSSPNENIFSSNSASDIFSEPVPKKEAQSSTNTNIFAVDNSSENSDSDDLFASASKKDKSSKLKKSTEKPNTKKSTDLFGNEGKSEETNDLFSSVSNEKTEDRKANSSTHKDSEKETESTASAVNKVEEDVKKAPIPTNATKNSKTEQSKKSANTNLFENNDDSSDEDIFASRSIPSVTRTHRLSGSNISKDISSVKQASALPQSKDLMSASDSVPSKSSKSQKGKGLFSSDSEDSDSDLFKSSTLQKKKKSFPKVEDPGRSNVMSSKDEPKQKVTKKPKPPATKSIFSDSSDDDLFATKDKKSVVI